MLTHFKSSQNYDLYNSLFKYDNIWKILCHALMSRWLRNMKCDMRLHRAAILNLYIAAILFSLCHCTSMMVESNSSCLKTHKRDITYVSILSGCKAMTNRLILAVILDFRIFFQNAQG